MGLFFKIWPNLSQNWLNLRKFWKKLVILIKIWPKIGPIGIWMGYFFLKKTGICMGLLSNSVAAHPYQNQTWVSYLYGATFKFRGGTSLPKPNLSIPPPGFKVPTISERSCSASDLGMLSHKPRCIHQQWRNHLRYRDLPRNLDREITPSFEHPTVCICTDVSPIASVECRSSLDLMLHCEYI